MSYSGNPADSECDAVRFLIGDTDESDELLSDEEIVWLVENEGSPLKAAIVAADTIANLFSGSSASYRIGSVEVRRGQRAEQFRRRADELRRTLLEQGVNLFAGGISIAQKDSVESDADRVVPHFKVGMFENT